MRTTVAAALLAALLAPVASAQTGRDDLVGWWKFDETEAGPVRDSSAIGNPGENRGAAIGAEGVDGKAYAFDGQNDFVLIPDHPSLRLPEQVTILCWIRAEDVSGDRFIVRKRNNYGLGFDADGRPTSVIQADWPGVQEIEFVLSPFTRGNAWFLNAWHQIGFTFDGTHVTHYVDGLPDGVPVGAIGHLWPQDALPLTLGQSSFDCHYFKGGIDDVRIYKRALTAPEILAAYNEVRGPFKPVFRSEPPTRAGVGERLLHRMVVVGNPAPAIEAVSLPAWLKFDGKETLRGRPGAGDRGRQAVELKAVNAQGETPLRFDVEVVEASVAPVGHWKLDGTEGDKVTDSSLQGNHGRSHGAGMDAPGMVGKAFSFGGAKHVSVPHSESLQRPTTLSLSAWIRLKEPVGYAFVAGKGRNYSLQIHDGRLVSLFSPRIPPFVTLGSAFPFKQPASWFVGDWHHVAFTFDGRRLTHYLDGMEESREPFYGLLDVSEKSPFTIGGDGHNGFPGEVDEVRVYDRALAAEEIRDLHRDARGPHTPIVLSLPRARIGVGQEYVHTLSIQADPPAVLSAVSLPGWLSFDGKETLRGRPGPGDPGAHAVEMKASNGKGDTLHRFEIEVTEQDAWLIGHWRFDETTGPPVDSSLRKNGAEHRGATPGQEGAVGKACGFDGDDFVAVKDAPVLQVRRDITVLAWIFPTDSAADRQTIVRRRNNYALYFSFGGRPATQLRLRKDPFHYVANWFAHTPFAGESRSLLNEWHHVGFTYDGKTVVHYLDGREESRLVTKGGDLEHQENPGDLAIGQDSFGRDFFKGRIDEVRLYDRALASDEVKRIFDDRR